MNTSSLPLRCSFALPSRAKEQRSGFLALVLALAVLFLACGAAVAAAPTRGEYVDTLEAICEPQAEATRKAVMGVRGDMNAERLALAATKFAKAKAIFGRTLDKLAKVPRPPADRPKLARWFGYLDRQEDLLGEIIAALRADDPVRSQRLTARFVHNGNLANNVVLAFGFEYCSFEFSRFG